MGGSCVRKQRHVYVGSSFRFSCPREGVESPDLPSSVPHSATPCCLHVHRKYLELMGLRFSISCGSGNRSHKYSLLGSSLLSNQSANVYCSSTGLVPGAGNMAASNILMVLHCVF